MHCLSLLRQKLSHGETTHARVRGDNGSRRAVFQAVKRNVHDNTEKISKICKIDN